MKRNLTYRVKRKGSIAHQQGKINAGKIKQLFGVVKTLLGILSNDDNEAMVSYSILLVLYVFVADAVRRCLNFKQPSNDVDTNYNAGFQYTLFQNGDNFIIVASF